MIGLNLLPDVKKEFMSAQRTRNFVISLSIVGMVVAIGVVVLLALVVHVGQETAINLQKDSIKKNQSELESKPEIEKYLTIQNQLKSLGVLHDQEHKFVYSRFFVYMVNLNPAEPNSVNLGNMKVASDTKTISLQGTTASFSGLNVFKSTLERAILKYRVEETDYEKPLFSEVTLKSAALSEVNNSSVVSFEFNLTYTPEAFQPNVTNPQLIIPRITISDSEQNAPNLSNGQEVDNGQAE